MQSENSEKKLPDGDRIQQLIEAARAEERAKMAVTAILEKINSQLHTLEHLEKEIEWIKSILQANYNNLATLIQLMAAVWQGDKSTLIEIQQRLAEQAFQASESSGIKVDVEKGNVKVSADKVGRDKKDGK